MNRIRLRPTPRSSPHKFAFTLIELSIVLVIIGLLVGGVLVGGNLVKSAQLRAVITQVEKYNAAVNAFRARFNGLPGDLPNASAYSGLLFVPAVNAGKTGLGDGNGILTSSGGIFITDATGEITMFWRHLSDAQLVDGTFADDVAGGPPYATLGTSFPRAKVGPAGIGVYGIGRTNYYQIGADSSVGNDLAVYKAGLNATEAWSIDSKMDDGIPLTGLVLARGWAIPNSLPTGSLADGTETSCTTDTDAALARYTTTIRTSVSCQLRIQMN